LRVEESTPGKSVKKRTEVRIGLAMLLYITAKLYA
jgi:hypothetical protein